MFFKDFTHNLIIFFYLLEIGVDPIWQNCLMVASANTTSTNSDSLVKNHAAEY